MFASLQPFIIAFLIGLIIGIERERSHAPGVQALGVRSFILIALLGTFASWLNVTAMTVVISGFVAAAILLGYFRSTEQQQQRLDIGLTTELSAGLVYCIGFLIPHATYLGLMLAMLVLLVLVGRRRLHDFARAKLRPQEIEAAVTLLLITLGILPFLPNHPIDPWGLFNPQRFGLLIVIIAALQFGGYVAIRVFGDRLGMLLMGFFGGFVSSTAVFMSLPHLIKKTPTIWRAAVAAAIFATIAMLLEFLIIIFTASPHLLTEVLWYVVAMLPAGLLSGILLLEKSAQQKLDLPPENPLHIKSVLRLAAFVGGMLILVTLARQYVGEEAVAIITFLAALFELHSVTLATSLLYAAGKLSLDNARQLLLFALAAAFISKFFLLWIMARNRFALITSLFLLAMLASSGLAYIFIE